MRDAEPEEFVVGQQHADYGAGHAGHLVAEKVAVGFGNVVGAGSGEGVGDVDVGIALSHKPDHPHRGLPALGIAGVEEHIVPGKAHGGKQTACSQEGVDAGLRIDSRDAVGLMMVFGDAEAIVVGRNGDQAAAYHALLHTQIATRGALVGSVNREMVVEHHAACRLASMHLWSHGDSAGKHDGLSEGVGGGVDEIIGHHAIGLIKHRVGDIGSGHGQVVGLRSDRIGVAREQHRQKQQATQQKSHGSASRDEGKKLSHDVEFDFAE